MRVRALFGIEPEVQAYAMARFSRSALSFEENLRELSAQKAEQFLNTFYFQYGHASIADLAHIPMTIEEVSILAAIAVVDEPLWDGQERSTRYQDFRRSGYYLPPEEALPGRLLDRYREACDGLFAAYHQAAAAVEAFLAQRHPRPPELPEAAYRRTVRARALDVARDLLPLATHTSLGQITSARVLERQIRRLLAHPAPEVQAVGAALREACLRPSLGPVPLERVAPTLVRYVEPDGYLLAVRRTVRAFLETHWPEALPEAVAARAAEAEAGARQPRGLAAVAGQQDDGLAEEGASRADGLEGSATVDLVEVADPLDEMAATLLFEQAAVPYRELVAWVAAHPRRRAELLDAVFAQRGPHDPWLRAGQAGYALQFELTLDIGAYRDLHRHRRCVQFVQPFTPAQGVVLPPALAAAGVAPVARAAVADALACFRELAAAAPALAPYILPLGTRCRALFKMDLAQLAYMAELRTRPAGHFAYRQVAHQMWQLACQRYPQLAAYGRVHDPEADPPEAFFAR